MLVADIWMPDDRDLMLVARRAPFDALCRSARRTSVSMAEDAHARLRAGLTTPGELARVLPYSAIVEHRARFGGRDELDPSDEERDRGSDGNLLDGLDWGPEVQER
jgi:hypothetical protein